jgi:exodeoxyribonuclease V alpha subunit
MNINQFAARRLATNPQPKVDFSKIRARILDPHGSESRTLIRQTTANADADAKVVAQMLARPTPEVIEIPHAQETSRPKLSSLIAKDFQFDESQLAAIEGIRGQQYACLTGSAGTGKTTVTKAVVDAIQQDIGYIDMKEYWKKNPDGDAPPTPERLVPAVTCVAYTGKASQQIKRNFPEDWHGNIMTIHRNLGFYPEFYEDFNDLGDGMVPKRKRRFVPAYTRANPLPWKTLVIDEAGMLSTDLWHQLWDACTPETRIIMIGDINQLVPTHGKSIFGFAMAKWPTWELTTIHRQKGQNNSIVDNAWRVIHGKKPISDKHEDPNWKFISQKIDTDPRKASRQIRAWLKQVKSDRLYDPHRDVVITPINAFKQGPGFELGQEPLNQELTMMFAGDEGRYVIDGGRDRRQFAIGDKVMVTQNDHEQELTNGMTGIVTKIVPNGAYRGNAARYGLLSEVNRYLADEPDNDMPKAGGIDLDKLMKQLASGEVQSKDDTLRGPSSHIVTVEFDQGASVRTVDFGSLTEIHSLMLAYVVTCHKMQGGEAYMVIIICHQAHGRMLNREWLYTAITRASDKCVLLYTDMGLSKAVATQSIKGATLKEKVESFNQLQMPKAEFGGAALMKIQLPNPRKADEHETSNS